MITFYVHLVKLLVDLRLGLKEDPEFRALLYTLFILVIGSTLFYSKVEGWSIVDSLYFSVMTMSTIGYGDFVPTTTISKLFTIVFALLSIGVFVAVVSKLVTIILKQKKKTYEKVKNFSTAYSDKAKPTNEEDKGGEKDDKKSS